jgi:hypothetical protein
VFISVCFVFVIRELAGKSLIESYLPAMVFNRVCPTINVKATIAPANMQAATSTSKSHVRWSMAKSITLKAGGRHGV